MRRKLVLIWLLLLTVGVGIILFFPSGSAVTVIQALTPEQRTERYFESIRTKHNELLAFLQKMPKGGDLHSHLSGAVYAETFIKWATQEKMCVDPETLKLFAQKECRGKIRLQEDLAGNDSTLYNRMIDAWSVRNSKHSGRSGHDQFFGAFDKFGLLSNRYGEMEAEVRSRAAEGRVSYLELMLTPDNDESKKLGNSLKPAWNGKFDEMRNRLLKNGLIDKAVRAGIKTLDEAQKKVGAKLGCDQPAGAKDGCKVEVRYIFQVGRRGGDAQVFAQMLTAFEMASADPRMVGLNLVQPEDDTAAMNNFPTHMLMIKYLHSIYSRVHITLHAGELAPGLVPPEGLRSHINDSVEIGRAERIGHGADVLHEDNADQLLQKMAERNIMVEICLTSNDVILNMNGDRHPLRTYIEKGVPVALATDDEGVARSDMTREYLRAVEDQRLNYPQLKKMARTSLEYAFVTGASLWKSRKDFELIPQCLTDKPESESHSSNCQQFLQSSEKARLQWQLEKAFVEFERQFP